MTISMVKIGSRLDSRPAGREAWLGMRPSLPKNQEDIMLDFQGVDLLTPSFADEFVTNLLEAFPKKVQWTNVRSESVVGKTLEFLMPQWKESGLVS